MRATKGWLVRVGGAVSLIYAWGAGANAAGAAEPAVGAAKEVPILQYGADERVREEAWANIPVKADPPGYSRATAANPDGEFNYARIRTRAWLQLNANEHFGLRVRADNEFRYYWTPDRSYTGHNAWNAPDEWLLDNLYLDANGLFDDALDLRIGRQDLYYGNGRLFMDGTPKDGSRSYYFDAIKATWHVTKKTSVDFLGIYDNPENELLVNSENRDLVGLSSAYAGMTESGGGFYLKSNESDVLPYEAYYLFKRESSWEQAAKTNAAGFVPPTYAWQTLDEPRKKILNPELDLHTVGFRLMPKWSDRVDASLEVAGQLGERGSRDVQAYMVDAYLNWHPAALASVKPTFTVGCYALSGDDPKTKDDEGWNPLYSRCPQSSELYVYAYDYDGVGRWSNLTMPHLDYIFSPAKWLKTTLSANYLYAPENDGPGPGQERGMLYVVKNEFTIASNLLREKDLLTAHLWLEVLEPGNYYNTDQTAYFARWQVSYMF